MKNYYKIVSMVQRELVNNPEWKDRYKGYLGKIYNNEPIILEARKNFYVPQPFTLYLPLSMAINATPNQANFDLRFHGQSVGTISVKDKKVLFTLKKIGQPLEKTATTLGIELAFTPQTVAWDSELAKQFRKSYQELENKLIPKASKDLGRPESNLESELLSNYAQKSSIGKEIIGIQPVKMLDACFQMPTPLGASKAKDNIVQYAGHSGGGIDILARIGLGGPSTKLAILELKDENNSSEPPEKAIKQAIAYAVFIRELFRCEEADGQGWWKFMGFGGKLPTSLILKAIIVMPYAPNSETDFGKQLLPLDPNAPKGDLIELEYIYRSLSDPQSRTSLY